MIRVEECQLSDNRYRNPEDENFDSYHCESLISYWELFCKKSFKYYHIPLSSFKCIIVNQLKEH